VKAAEEARKQSDAIRQNRLLLSDPDPITPLVKSVEDTLRSELMTKHEAYKSRLGSEHEFLDNDPSWSQVPAEEQAQLLSQCDIEDPGELSIGSQDELLTALQSYPISSWDDRIDAVSSRFGKARELAVKKVEPEATTVDLPRRTLRDSDEVNAWMEEVKKRLTEAVAKGPVILK
jgi:hypothetical protein